MIPRGVDLFLFLCVPFFVFVTGHSNSDESADGNSNDGCNSFRQGYFDHYKCTLQCFNDVYQLRYIYGNMCEGTVEMDSNNWGAVPFPKIIQCMECITIRCRQSIPQSVCDGSFTVSNNNYGQSWSWKENYGDKYVNNQNQPQTNTQPDSSLSNRNYWYGRGAPSSNTGNQNYQAQTNNQPGSSFSNQNYWYGGGVPSSNTGGQNYQSQMNFQPGSYPNRNFWYGNRGNAPSSNTGGGTRNQDYQYQANAPPNSQYNQNGGSGNGGDSDSSEEQTVVEYYEIYDSNQQDNGDQSGKDYDAPIANTKSSGKTRRPKITKSPKPTRASKIKDKYSSLLWKKSQKDKSTNAPSDSYDQYYDDYEDNGNGDNGSSDNGNGSDDKSSIKIKDKYGSLLRKKSQKDKSTNAPSDSYDQYYDDYEDNGNGDNGSSDNGNGSGDKSSIKIKDKYGSLLRKKSQKDKSTNAPSDSYDQYYDDYEDNGSGDNGNGDSTQENVSDSNNYGASSPSTTDSGYPVSTTEQSSVGSQSSYGDGNGYATSTQSTDDKGDDYYYDEYYYDYYYDDDSDNQTVTSPVSTATENTGGQYTDNSPTAVSTEAITDNVPTTSQNPSTSESTNNNNYSNSQTESTNDGNTSPNYSTEAPKESTTSASYDYDDAYAAYEAAENADSENTSAGTLETSSKISQTTSSSVSVYSNSYYESDDSSSTQNSKTVTDLTAAPSSASNYPNDNGSNETDYYYYYYYYYDDDDDDDDDTSSISSTTNGYDNAKIDSFATKNTDWKAYTDSSNKEYDDSNKQSQDTDSNSSNDYSSANYQSNQGNNGNNQYQWNQASDGLSNSNTGPGTNKNLTYQSNGYNKNFNSPLQDNTRFRPWNPSYTNNSPSSYQNRSPSFNNRNTGPNIGNQPDKSDFNYNPSGNNYQRNFNIENQNVQPVQGPSKNWNVNPATNNQQPSWQRNVIQYPNYDTYTATGQSSADQNNQGTGNGQAPSWNLAKTLFQKPSQTRQVASPNQNLGPPGIGDSNPWSRNWQTQFSDRNPPYIKPENSQSQANGGFSDQRFRNVESGAATGQQSFWSGNSQSPSFNQWSLQNQQGQQFGYGGSAPNIESKETVIEFDDDKIVLDDDGEIIFFKGGKEIVDIP